MSSPKFTHNFKSPRNRTGKSQDPKGLKKKTDKLKQPS